jgi:hypothetical protein
MCEASALDKRSAATTVGGMELQATTASAKLSRASHPPGICLCFPVVKCVSEQGEASNGRRGARRASYLTHDALGSTVEQNKRI